MSKLEVQKSAKAFESQEATEPLSNSIPSDDNSVDHRQGLVVEDPSTAQAFSVVPRQKRSRGRAHDTDAKERTLLAETRPAPAPVRFPTLPTRIRKRSFGTLLSFAACVVLPTVAVAIYYFHFAANQYVSDFRFSVRDSKSAAAGVAAMPSGLAATILGGGTAQNSEENYIVTDYLTSHQAVEDLSRIIDVKGLYSRPEADWFARFDSNEPIEKFFVYWKRMVTASYDQITGISVAQVRAFTPEDSYRIATELVKLSEKLINEVANRPQMDAIKFAEDELARAEERLKTIRSQVTNFRNTERLIDPQTSVVTSNILLAQTLRANLAQLQTELSSLEQEKLGAGSPVIQALKSRLKATREQLAIVESQVASLYDGNTPLSKVVGTFEQLELEKQFAQNMMMAAKQNLEHARANAIAQHVYITPFVKPVLATSSTYPRRVLSGGIAAFGFFLFWLLGLLVVRSIREHLV